MHEVPRLAKGKRRRMLRPVVKNPVRDRGGSVTRWLNLPSYLAAREEKREKPKNRVAVQAAHMEQGSRNESMVKGQFKQAPTPCNIHVHSRRHGLADADGISFKATLDGIVAAQILPEDNAEVVKSVTYSQERIPRAQKEETVITITACDVSESSPDAQDGDYLKKAIKSAAERPKGLSRILKQDSKCSTCVRNGITCQGGEKSCVAKPPGDIVRIDGEMYVKVSGKDEEYETK